MDYTTLVAAKTTDGSIKNWINNSTIPATQVLAEAEAWIYQRLRVREMLATATGTISSGVNVLALPSGYRDSRIFRYTGIYADTVEKRLLEEVEEAFEYDSAGNRAIGKPLIYYPDATQFVFPVTTDQAYPYRLSYFSTPSALSGSNTTNFLTSRYPRLLRCACLAFANEFLKDQAEKQYWLALATDDIDEINAEADRDAPAFTVMPE